MILTHLRAALKCHERVSLNAFVADARPSLSVHPPSSTIRSEAMAYEPLLSSGLSPQVLPS